MSCFNVCHLSFYSVLSCFVLSYCFFFNDTATTEIYTYLHTLSLHDALPICLRLAVGRCQHRPERLLRRNDGGLCHRPPRSEEHTSELQSLMRISYAVFCLKKKK